MSEKGGVKSLLFTDLYQLTMAAAYFDCQKQNETAVFEVFFRKCPFSGEYAIFSGVDLLKDFIDRAKFRPEDVEYLKSLGAFRSASQSFFEALKNFDLRDVEIRALSEGEPVFARTPLLQLKGPLWKLQCLESGVLNAINFSTLCATYARRIRMAAPQKNLVEFGMRRAQGPNGAFTATRSSILGGFDGSSHVEAAKELGIPPVGTMAHSFVQSFHGLEDSLLDWNGSFKKELDLIIQEDGLQTHEGELAAFIAYAKSFPDSAMLLVDTYNGLKSGVPNAIRAFKLLRNRGHQALGIRLDSGDLNYLSKESRKMLDAAGFPEAKIFASNDLNEDIISSLLLQGAAIDGFGVGTHLVTCREQPALGGIYKLVELEGRGRIKLSEQTDKMTLPFAKEAYRLYGERDIALMDYLCLPSEKAPEAGQDILALHPFDAYKRARIRPHRVKALLQPLFSNGNWLPQKSLLEARQQSLEWMKELRPDVLRRDNPTPYKVSLSERLKSEFDQLFHEQSPPARLA